MAGGEGKGGKDSHQSCPRVTGHTGTPASCPTLGIKPSPTIPGASVLSAIQLFLVRVPGASDLKVQLRVAGWRRKGTRPPEEDGCYRRESSEQGESCLTAAIKRVALGAQNSVSQYSAEYFGKQNGNNKWTGLPDGGEPLSCLLQGRGAPTQGPQVCVCRARRNEKSPPLRTPWHTAGNSAFTKVKRRPGETAFTKVKRRPAPAHSPRLSLLQAGLSSSSPSEAGLWRPPGCSTPLCTWGSQWRQTGCPASATGWKGSGSTGWRRWGWRTCAASRRGWRWGRRILWWGWRRPGCTRTWRGGVKAVFCQQPRG